MITAENITDEQINRLRDLALVTGNTILVQECNLALGLPTGFDRDMWRARCAQILSGQISNTRTAGTGSIK